MFITELECIEKLNTLTLVTNKEIINKLFYINKNMIK